MLAAVTALSTTTTVPIDVIKPMMNQMDMGVAPFVFIFDYKSNSKEYLLFAVAFIAFHEFLYMSLPYNNHFYIISTYPHFQATLYLHI